MLRIAVIAIVCLIPAVTHAADVSYNRDVRPILSNRCFKCHGSDFKKGGLDLRDRTTALANLTSGAKAIVAGKSADSEMIHRVSAADDRRMPPKGDPLTPEQIATLKAWIDQGAKYEDHWAFIAPKPAVPPDVKNAGWVRNPIDRFVLAKLEREELAPSPEADRVALIRRVRFDLTGLPPSPQEVDAFVNDSAPDAYEKLVERLLQSPHAGEHLARWWLDLARYGDSNGYEKDERRTAWPYRDWVIAAFNRDLPFDRFTIEQLAGDLLPGATIDQKVATGFHRNSLVTTENGTDDEEFRLSAVVDRVNTTAAVWLGLTLNCCQCHNHKFDPFTQKEFYQLFAFFNGTADKGKSNDPQLPVPKYARPGGKTPTALVMQELPALRPTFIHIRGNFRTPGETVMPNVPAKLHPISNDATPNRLGLAKWLVDPANPLIARVTVNRLWGRMFGRGIVESSEDFGLQGELPTHPELLDWLAVEFINQNWSIRSINRLIVTSATYRQASTVTPASHQRDPYNRLFARGPRLRLDAEAVRDNALVIGGLLNQSIGGPSVFPYQPDGVWASPYSQDKWTSATDESRHRRGLYTFWKRTAPYGAFAAFDAPSREVTCDRRPRTNTPLQALATLNDKAFVECAAGLARRILVEEKGDNAAKATFAFRCCTGRAPSAAELKLLLSLYQSNRDKYRRDAAAAKLLANSGLGESSVGTDAEVAAWTVVANVLLNLDETVTKE